MGFFAVWTDELHDVSGSRFGPDGELLEAEELPLIATWQDASFPATVWNGSEYVTLASAGELGIFKSRVKRNGEAQGGGEPITGFPGAPPSLVWNGSRYAYSMIEYSSTRQGFSSLRIAFLDASLAVVNMIPIGSDDPVRFAQIATDGTNFLVLWESIHANEDVIWAERFDSDGMSLSVPQRIKSIPLDTSYPLSPGELRPSVVWNGNNYFVVWTAGSVEGMLIGRDGTFGQRFTISTETHALAASVAWDGFAILITWNQQGPKTPEGAFSFMPAAALVTSTGDPIDTISIPHGPTTFGPDRASIASNGSVFLVVWFGERFIISSTTIPHLHKHIASLTRRFNEQLRPAIAAGTSNLLVAWYEAGSVYAGRLSRSGEPLDGGGIEVAKMISNSGDLARLSVISNGGVYLIFWQDGGGVIGAVRISESGALLDPQPIVMAGKYGYGQPIAAAAPDRFRILWAEILPGSLQGVTTVVTAEIPSTGSVDLRPSPPLFPDRRSQIPNAVIWNGTGYTVIWTQQLTIPCYGRGCPPDQFEIRVSTLTASGEPLLTRALVVNAGFAGFLDAIKTADNQLLLAYLSEGLIMQRLKLTGEAFGPPALVPVSTDAYAPLRLAQTPSGFIAVYNAVSLLANPTHVTLAIRAINLNADGTARTPELTFLAGEDFWTIGDLIVDNGQFWLTYSAYWAPRPNGDGRSIRRAYFSSIRSRVHSVSH